MILENKGRTEKAMKNIAFNVSNQIITLILALISRRVFIKGFGIEFLGINGLFSDILSLLSMADLGFNTAMVFSFYKPLAENDNNKIAALIGFYKKIYTIIALLIALIGVAMIPFLPKLVKLDYEVPHLSLYYVLSLSSVVASYLFVYKTSILTADQKGYKITRITIITNFAKTIIQIISILLFRNYILYLVIGIVIAISNNIIASHVSQKEYPFINQKNNITEEEKRSIFQNIGSVFVYKVSSVLINATDNLIISTIVGTVFVGLYSNYLVLQKSITTVFSLVFSSMIASIGNLIVTEKNKKRLEIFQCEHSICCMISGFVIPCYVLLADDFIKVWLGKDFQFSFLTTCAIGLNMYLSCVLQPLWSYREATGLYRRTKWIMLICAVENVILSILLGLKIGVTGIILASAISRISTYVLYEPNILFKEYFGQTPKNYYINLLLNFVLIIGVTAVLFWVFTWFEVSNWITWLIKAVIIGIISIIIMLLVYHKSNGYCILKEKAKSIMNRH